MVMTLSLGSYLNLALIAYCGRINFAHRFSITKWIHLNDGDEGLEAFFRRVFEVLKPGGKFLLEPQPWDSYRKARRGNTKMKETAAAIQIRPEGFGKVLEGIGFHQEGRFETGSGTQGELDTQART